MTGIEGGTESVTENGRTWKSWVMIVVVILTWIVSASVQWGITSAHQVETDRRLEVLETSQRDKMDRAEFDSWRKYLDNRFDRVESKLDTIMERK